MRVLVVEDEKKIADLISRGLGEDGYKVSCAGSGEEALELGSGGGYDFILLDIMLPGIDGISVCKRLRVEGVASTIIMLTARDAVSDKVLGLDSGADDYLTKPFAFEELLARMRALSRKGKVGAQTVLRFEDLSLDLVSHTAKRGAEDIVLSNREYALLEYLMSNPGVILSRTMIAQKVWGIDFDTFTNTIDVYINYLRNKIDVKAGRKLIHTVRGRGYCLGDPLS
jgi:DNA-binding response OmpR family regulator